MAKLILTKNEGNPYNDNGVCVFGYFDGTPTRAELRRAGGGGDGFTDPERVDDDVSKRAGLQRWLLAQAV